jgi:hypothetical protein
VTPSRDLLGVCRLGREAKGVRIVDPIPPIADQPQRRPTKMKTKGWKNLVRKELRYGAR